jgi:hypothetical protein
MSKYNDLLSILNYIREEKVEKRRPRYRREKDMDDPFTQLVRMKRMADEFKKFTEDLEKINKKEEKKKVDGWESYTFIQKFVIMTALVPFVIVIELAIPAILIMKLLH